MTTKKTGIGLGLSMVSKIVDGHRGSIRVENAGRRVERRLLYFFPLEEVGEAVPGTDASRRRRTTNVHAYVLIIEDEAKMRRLLELNLGEDGFKTSRRAMPKRG